MVAEGCVVVSGIRDAVGEDMVWEGVFEACGVAEAGGCVLVGVLSEERVAVG
jgi:hypothetical protein